MIFIFLILLHLLERGMSAEQNQDLEDLKTPHKQLGEFCGYESCHRVQQGVLNVHIVPTTYFDMGLDRSFESYYSGEPDKPVEFLRRSQINVKNALDTIVTELWAARDRRFTLVDIPYFFHWWSRRDETVRRMVHELVRQGRLVFVGGAWGLSDGTVANYQAIVDSFTYGLRKLNDTFGKCGRPLVAWQAESYGHSREMASLVAAMGYDALFVSPISYDEEIARLGAKALEMVWRGSDDLGVKSDIFTSKLFDGYWAPPGFCFDDACQDDDLILDSDDTLSNVAEKVKEFVRSATLRQAPYYRTKNIMMTMGSRHGYYYAKKWFTNMDKLIQHVRNSAINYGSEINVFYSTPFCYLRAVYNANPQLPIKQDDFVPLAQQENDYFTGMYTSRPNFKYMIKVANTFAQIAKQLYVTSAMKWLDDVMEDIKWVNSAVQEHNIITGATRQYVTDYYAHRLYIATQKATVIMKNAFNKLRGSSVYTTYFRCLFNVSECHSTSSERSFIVTYNPLAWPVSIPVRLPIRTADYSVYDHKGAEVDACILPIPEQVLQMPFRATTASLELVFMVNDIPPLGFTSHYIAATATRRRVPKSATLFKKLDKKKKKPKLYMSKNLNQASAKEPKDKNNSTRNEDDYESEDDLTRTPKIIFADLPNRLLFSSELDAITPRMRTLQSNKTEEHTTEAAKEEKREGRKEKVKKEADETKDSVENVIPIEIFGSARRMKTDQDLKDDDMIEDLIYSAEESTVATTSVEITEEVVTSTIESTTEHVELATESLAKATGTTEAEMVYEDYDYQDRKGKSRVTSAHISGYNHIKNKYIKINMEQATAKVANLVLSSGAEVALDIQFGYYEAFVQKSPEEGGGRSSGAYLFKPLTQIPWQIFENAKSRIYKSPIVEEIHLQSSDYTSLVLRLYIDTPYIEVEWTVGPIPIENGKGKEIILKYSTDLNSNNVFYTDSNGRQTIKRRFNERASYKYKQVKPVVGNYYPVTSKIHIEDLGKKLRFAILNDRPQGGGCLNDGEIELLVHRRLVSEETKMGVVLNETAGGIGMVARGKHYLFLAASEETRHKIYEKKLAKEIHLPPQVMVSKRNPDVNRTAFAKLRNRFTALKAKLPLGIHLLTLERWKDDCLLVRLENYLEKSDLGHAKTRKVNLLGLFADIQIVSVRETSLGANVWKNDASPLQWQTEKRFLKSFNRAYGAVDAEQYSGDEEYATEEVYDWREGVKLAPMEIKTFVVEFKYV